MKKHPELARKLSLLYSLRLNSNINSHADLARELGISRQAVSKWMLGSETTTGDCVPNRQLNNLENLYPLEGYWFTLPFAEFEEKIRQVALIEVEESRKRPLKISLAQLPITNADIFGRDWELASLDSAWDDSSVNILQLIGFGGVGKSALVNYWLSQFDKDNYRSANKVYAWSFYWQGTSSDVKSSGDFFIEHALEWFGDARPTQGTPWAKASRLATLIRESKTLLILDGIEPLQQPPGSKNGKVENPAVALLLRELANYNNGLCIVTSRLAISDLAGFKNDRVRTRRVENLTSKFGVELLKNIGVNGERRELALAVRNYLGHPLSLTLLGGFLSSVHHGNIGKFRELSSLLDEKSQGSHANNLMKAYLDWVKDSPSCSLLYLIGLYDRAVSLSDIKSLVKLESIDGLTAELANLTNLQWGYAIEQLTDSNLVSIEGREDERIIDCHPLVRDFVGGYLRKEHLQYWQKGHNLIFQLLQNTARDEPSNMVDLEPLFRAVIHGAQAGRYSEAFSLYFKKIKKGYTLLTEGSHIADQACIRAFFIKEWDEPAEELSEVEKVHLLSSVATNLMSLGQIEQSIEPYIKSIQWFVEREKWLEAAASAGPFVSMLLLAGKLKEAISFMEGFKDCIDKTNNSVIQAMALNFQAHAYHLIGNDTAAKELFQKAEKILTLDDPGTQVAFPTVSSYYCKFLLESDAPMEALERSLKTIAWRNRGTWQVAIETTSIIASDLLVLGLIFLKLGDIPNAKAHLNKQLEIFRSADEWLYLPSSLNSRAQLYIATKEYSAANQDLQEALKISLRTGAKLGEWEAYINLSLLNLEQRKYLKSKKYLAKAKNLPEMDVYRFRDDEIQNIERRLSSC